MQRLAGVLGAMNSPDAKAAGRLLANGIESDLDPDSLDLSRIEIDTEAGGVSRVDEGKFAARMAQLLRVDLAQVRHAMERAKDAAASPSPRGEPGLAAAPVPSSPQAFSGSEAPSLRAALADVSSQVSPARRETL